MYRNNSIGRIIKTLRKSLRITQKGLSEGICTQAEISRIENGANMPYADTLYRIALRLGVDVNYFFEYAHTPRLDYIKDTFTLLRSMVNEDKYEEIERLVKSELKNPLFSPPVYQQFLLWHKGMVEHYIYHRPKKAIKQLWEAIEVYQETTGYTETQIEILITLGNIYSEITEYDKSIDMYYDCLEQLKKLARITNLSIEARILYNLALTLSKKGRDDLAIEPCKQGIKLCRKEKDLYIFGELYYQLGYSLWKIQHIVQAKESLETAILIFELLDMTTYVKHTKEVLKEIES